MFQHAHERLYKGIDLLGAVALIATAIVIALVENCYEAWFPERYYRRHPDARARPIASLFGARVAPVVPIRKDIA